MFVTLFCDVRLFVFDVCLFFFDVRSFFVDAYSSYPKAPVYSKRMLSHCSAVSHCWGMGDNMNICIVWTVEFSCQACSP